jgi:hypothetical protein
MDYQIPIPSYKRIDTLTKATLPMLEKFDCDPKRVTIFVANDEEYAAYRSAIPKKYKIVRAELGLLQVKRFYHHYYDAGTPLFNVQDDIYDLKQKLDNKLETYLGSLDDLVSLGFKMAKVFGADMWGLNPTGNPMFMKDYVSIGLRFIYGAIYGDYAGNPSVLGKRIMELPSGEDWENTISSYLRTGALVRIEWITPISKLFAKGGMSDYLTVIGTNRNNDHENHLRAIAAHYPDLVRSYRKAGNVLNLRLKTLATTKIPRQEIESETK